MFNSWDHMFWIFKAYLAVSVLAQGFPSNLNFAQKFITDNASSRREQEVHFIPLSFKINHSHLPNFYQFDEVPR